jgi:PAS domain S-box-containing protein
MPNKMADRVSVAIAPDVRPTLDEYCLKRHKSINETVDIALREHLTKEGFPEPLDGLWDVAKMPAIAHKIDGQGFILDISEPWLGEFGYARKQVRFHRLREFMTEQSQWWHDENIKTSVEDRPPSFIREMICGDGVTVKKVKVALARRFDCQGKLIDVMSILTVIDE